MENTTTSHFYKRFLKSVFFKRCLFTFIAINTFVSIYAANISSTVAGGNWSSGSTWVGGIVPGSNDIVTIVAGSTVTVTAAATCNTLIINGSLTMNNTGFTFSLASGNGNQGILTLNAGGSFFIGSANTVEFTSTQGGTITNNGGSIASTGVNGSDGGTILADACCGGNFTINGSAATTVYNLKFVQNVGFNTTNAPNNMRINGTFTIPNNNWNWSSGSAPIYGPGSTLYINRGNQGLTPPYTYWAAIAPGAGIIGTTAGYPNNVTVVTTSTSQYNGAGVELTGSLSINGTFAIGDGTTPTFADITQVTAFTCGGILIDNGSQLVGTNFTVNGSWTEKGATQGIYKDVGGGTITFSGTGTTATPNTISASSATGLSFNQIIVGSASQKTVMKLQTPVSIASNINLQNATILTDPVNVLTLANVSPTAAITTANNSFVDGPLQWDIAASTTASPKIYIFPVGNGSTYLPLTLQPNSTNGNSVTVQAIASGSGGTPDITTVTTLSNSEYWAMSATQPFTSGATISATRPSGVGAFNMMAMSKSSAAGVYSSIGGTISGNSIINAGSIGTSSPWYFAMANGPLSLKTLSVNNPTCTGTTGSVTLSGAGGTPPYFYAATSAGPFTAVNQFSPLPAGTYVFYAQDNTHSKTVTDTVVLKPLTLIPDTTVCSGNSIALTTSGGYSYQWTSVPAGAFTGPTNIASPVATPTANTTYYVTAVVLNTSTNYIVNGDFESANTSAPGFSSGYINVTGKSGLPYSTNTSLNPLGNSGIYDIDVNANKMCIYFDNLSDHTSGTGKFLIVDGITTNSTTTNFWSQTITGLTVGTDYVFQYYFANADPTTPLSTIQTQINGTPLTNSAPGYSANPYGNSNLTWNYVAYKWTATSTTATIAMFDTQNASNGNDFAIDDISMYATCTANDSVHIKLATQAPAPSVVSPVNYCLNATAKPLVATGGTGATLYWYTTPTGGTSSTTIPTPSTTTAGTTTYYVSQIIPGGCSESPRDSIKVNILTSTPPKVKDTTICSGNSSVTLTAIPSGSVSDIINWYSDAALTNLVHTGASYPNVTISTNPTKFYLTENNGSCTSGDTTLTVNVNTSPTVSGTTSVCLGSTTTLTGSGTAAVPTAWTAINPTIATVDNTGKVLGVLNGAGKIVYKDNNGCTDTATVTVNALPTTSPASASVCVGNTTTLTGSGTPATPTAWATLDGTIASVNNSGKITGVANGIGKLIVYTDNNGCADTATVTVNALPAITGNTTVNRGGTTTLTGNGTPASSNAWQSLSPAIAIIDPTSGLVTANTTVDGTTKIVYTNSSGCTDTIIVNVTSSAVISGDTVVCVGSTTQLTGSGTPATTNAWVSASPSIATVNSNGLVTAIATGTSIVTYTQSNGKDTTVHIIVNALPTVTFTTTNMCVGKTITLSGSGTAATTNPWLSLNTSVATVNNGVVTGKSTGNGKYIVYTDNNGCADTASITVNGLPTISPATPNGICAGGGTTTLTGSGTAAASNAWTSVSTSIATVNSNSGVVTGVAGGNDNIVYTDNNGCTDTVMVPVNALPMEPIGADSSRCGTGKLNLAVTPSGGVTDTIKWYSDLALTMLLTKGNNYTTPTITTVGSTPYYVTETNIAGCVSNTAKTINAIVASGPTPPTGVNASRCGNGSVTLAASTNGAPSDVIAWYSDMNLTTQIPGITTSYPTPLLSDTTNYYITEVNTAGCASTPVTITAFINPVPSAPIGKDTAICGSGSVTLRASLSGLPTDALTWYSDNGLTMQVGSGTSISVPFVTDDTSFYITETTSTANCASTATTITVQVNSIPSAPTPIDSSLCGPGIVIIGATPVTNETDTIKWYSDAGLANQLATGTIFQTPSINTTTPYYATATSSQGCTSTSSTTVIAAINTKPIVQLTPIAAVCQGAPMFALSGGTPAGGSYSGLGVISDSAFNPQQSGNFPVAYTYIAANGCSASALDTIEVYPAPIINYGSSVSVLLGDSITLSPTQAGTSLSYIWSPFIYLNNDTSATPVCRPADTVTYTITATSPGGCSASTTLFVQVLQDFTVPNTFTPNNDGINDKWVIPELPKFPIQWVQVFDRYGQLLYESHGYSTPWDGTYKGKPLPAGTYYYIIELNGVVAPKTGYVTILR